jgi:hypothetical protein
VFVGNVGGDKNRLPYRLLSPDDDFDDDIEYSESVTSVPTDDGLELSVNPDDPTDVKDDGLDSPDVKDEVDDGLDSSDVKDVPSDDKDDVDNGLDSTWFTGNFDFSIKFFKSV